MRIHPRSLNQCGLKQYCRYAEESVDLLLNSGLQFDRHEREGIEPIHFAEMLIVSGIVLLDNVKWLSFHSGYDFG